MNITYKQQIFGFCYSLNSFKAFPSHFGTLCKQKNLWITLPHQRGSQGSAGHIQGNAGPPILLSSSVIDASDFTLYWLPICSRKNVLGVRASLSWKKLLLGLLLGSRAKKFT